MSPELGVIIMMNNYFHDVATALLMASGFFIWIIVKKYDDTGKNPETGEYFLKIYSSATKLAKFALIWIVLGGIPRTIFYKDFEWANAAGKGQIPALIVKHILAFAFVGTGVYLWHRINRRVKEIKG
ncbi:MAG: hypothetical protein C4538_04930 [Nitrospiraceae bacterium]|nr:MAG: hypothetical protein C4538_04930 [Nitrospiraceae bacterium]